MRSLGLQLGAIRRHTTYITACIVLTDQQPSDDENRKAQSTQIASRLHVARFALRALLPDTTVAYLLHWLLVCGVDMSAYTV